MTRRKMVVPKTTEERIRLRAEAHVTAMGGELRSRQIKALIMAIAEEIDGLRHHINALYDVGR